MIKKQYRATINGIAFKEDNIGYVRLTIYSAINNDLRTRYEDYHLINIREHEIDNPVSDTINVYVTITLEFNEKPIKIERID